MELGVPVEGTRFIAGRILKPCKAGNSHADGYWRVGLKDNRRERDAYVHELVLEAFVGPRPDGYTCCHNDGDPFNNHVDNLRWGSRSKNEYDKVFHGTHQQASKTHCRNGHEYTPENTRLYTKRGFRERQCKACALTWSRASKDRIKTRSIAQYAR